MAQCPGARCFRLGDLLCLRLRHQHIVLEVNATLPYHVVGTVLPVILLNLGQRGIILLVAVSEYYRQQETPANRYAQNPCTRQ